MRTVESQHAYFEKQIRPLLVEKCYSCHSAAQKKSKGDLTLDTEAGWLKGGEHGPAILPGKPDQSPFIQAIRYTGDLRMPPKSHGGKLSDKQIVLLENWVRDGAVAPQSATVHPSANWWAFQPVKSIPPSVASKLHPIDAFIEAQLQAKGLKPAAQADNRTLLRRVTYDLTGLPPTVEEMNQYLADTSPRAWQNVIDRLLASPQYGVRWARHWLDVVRYADSLDERSYDKEGDILDAWRYRDWVVNAFNSDLPYDQFVIHQLAGDILANQPGQWSRDKLIATGMYAIGNWGNGDADKEKLHTDIVDDQVDVTSRAFLGLTLACARCHDHKFDPISTRDYYAMAGFFFSSHILDKFQSKGEGEKLMRIPLQSPQQKIEQGRLQDRLAAIDKALGQALRPLTVYSDKVAGLAGVIALNGNGFSNPSMVINTTDKTVSYSTIKLKPRSLAVHPGPQIPVTVVWKSPLEGPVTMTVKLGDADSNCGNGIDWHLRHGSKVLHEGVMDNGCKVELPVARVDVKPGDLITLVIGPRSEYSCDTTDIEFSIEGPNGLKSNLVQSMLESRLQQSTIPAASISWIICSGSGTQLVSEDKLLINLEAERNKLQKQMGEMEYTQGMLEGGIAGTPYAGIHDARVHKRGSYNRLGDLVPRGFPVVLSKNQSARLEGSGRLQLARWIASPDHPLTARVMVNRLWQHHFGEGLVRTPNNFGKLGSVASHPELLDFLASEFIRSGWSIKAMHRLILNSEAYRRSSVLGEADKSLAQQDADNLWLGRQNRRRLSAEELRDSLLAASGTLDDSLGGKAVRDLASKRRTLYITTIRSDRATYQALFDVADSTGIVENRTEATVAPQALWLLNHPLAWEHAKLLAAQVARQPGSVEAKQLWLSQRLYQRPATEKELALAARLITQAGEAIAWERWCHVLLCANEFCYLD